MRRLLLVAVVVLSGTAATSAHAQYPGFKTTQPAMLTPVAADVTVDPLITVGETLPSGYMFESIPDGISVLKQRGERVHVFVNHETSLVPFQNESDFTNSLVSLLRLNTATGGVLTGRYVIPNEANFQRFCSNFLVRRAHGFSRPFLFTNEESSDMVNRTGAAYPPGPAAEQAGLVVAYDIRNDRYRAIRGMGRHNHENSVAIPGYGRPAILSTDDTFNAPSSQLYLYTAQNADAVWNDQGSLWAFKSNKPWVNDYSDLQHGATVAGRFIRVPRAIALGDQTTLEDWSNENNVFQFIRLEDVAYGRNAPNVVYMADTGEPRALPGPGTARMTRGPSGTTGPFPNGRIFKMVLDEDNPRRVKSLSILIEGDPIGSNSSATRGGPITLIHNPDNLETTRRSLLIQEDPGSQNQYSASNAAGTTARIWRYDLTTGNLTVVARVNQAATPTSAQGNWESSGIVNASSAFGAGAFLVDVQAHSLRLQTTPGPGYTFKREGGQLLLIRIPGA